MILGIPIKRKESSAQQQVKEGLAQVLDFVAPSAFQINPNYLQLGELYVRTLFSFAYPRFLNTNWLSPVINSDAVMDIAFHIAPSESRAIMGQLRRKVTQLESTQAIEQEKGQVRDPQLETAIQDIEGLRDVLQRGESRIFEFGLYFTLYAKSLEELETLTEELESTLGGMLVYTKQALLQVEAGFNSTLPVALDGLAIHKALDTSSISSAFPFVSADLSAGEGVLYGLNRHNNSLVLFDRFNLENANMVVFGTTGSGKSYAIKIEILRSLMLGAEVIIIDPENEYQALTEAVGGTWLPISLSSPVRLNPFDLPPPQEGGSAEEGTSSGGEALRETVTAVHGLVALMVKGLTPEEDALLDRALYETYALKDITADPATHTKPPPLLSDLASVLKNLTGAEKLLQRLTKFTQGTFAGLFNAPSNVKLTGRLVTFSVRDLEEALRPVAMYMVLNHTWTLVRRTLKKRMMVVDEAWWMMQNEDSARFLYTLIKRARKYYLGLTVITQDVEDFLDSKYGRAVINNSALQLLLKQSTAAIDKVAEAFHLTEGEKFLLLESGVGDGLFFAGQSHVAIKIVGSFTEDQIITTDPKQLLELAKRGELPGEAGGEETKRRGGKEESQRPEAELSGLEAAQFAPTAKTPAKPKAKSTP